MQTIYRITGGPLVTLGATLIVCILCNAQRRDYLKTAEVEERRGVVRVFANDPRPLAQALCAITKRNEWLVDYEDPPYAGNFEMVDATNPEWRASHPNTPPVMVPNGGAFEFKYDEALTANPNGEKQVLEALVSAYNQTGNPGRFEVRELSLDWRPWSVSHKRYAIVGVAIRGDREKLQPVDPILDTLITLPIRERSASETIRLIGDEVFAKRQVKVIEGGFANNALIHSRVTVGGTNVSARSLLLQTLGALANPSMGWRAKYDETISPLYVLNIGIIRGCD